MGSSKNIEIEGIAIEITKKKMKNMLIKIDRNGLVKVSIPNRVTYDEAEKFVIKNFSWIKDKLKEAKKRVEKKPVDYISGESIELWGNKIEIEFVPSYIDKGAYVKDDKLIVMAPLDSDSQQRKAIVDSFFRESLLEAINDLKEECCQIAGVSPKEWHIRDMKTKWGTCNYTASRIWISLMLVSKPKICLKYVMLHELTHLYVPNHGPEFKTYMDKFCPSWRQIRKMLNS